MNNRRGQQAIVFVIGGIIVLFVLLMAGMGGGGSGETEPTLPSGDTSTGLAKGFPPTILVDGIVDGEQSRALQALARESTRQVSLISSNGSIRYVAVAIPLSKYGSQADGARSFLDENAASFGLQGFQSQFSFNSVENSPAGDSVYRFDQAINGITVLGSELAVRVDQSGEITSISGDYITGDYTPPAAVISEEEAISTVGTEIEIINPPLFSDPRLVILSPRILQAEIQGNYLAWEVVVDFSEVGVIWSFFIDAVNGGLILDYPIVHAINAEVYDYQNTNDANSLIQIGSTSDRGKNTNSGDDAISQLESLYGFFRTLGRNGFDNQDGLLKVFVNKDFLNAYARPPNEMVFGSSFFDPDILGHEYTHLIINHSSDLNYVGESGALNESYADFFGTLYEATVRNDMGDWNLIGEGLQDVIPEIDFLRDLREPSKSSPPQPGHFSSFQNALNSLDCIVDLFTKRSTCVHVNSGIPNRAHYMIVEGDPNYLIQGMGEEKAKAILFSTMLSLPKNASFKVARETAIQTCASLVKTDPTYKMDDCSMIASAYAAVGIGKDQFGSSFYEDFNDAAPQDDQGCPAAPTTDYTDCGNYLPTQWQKTAWVWKHKDDAGTVNLMPKHVSFSDGAVVLTVPKEPVSEGAQLVTRQGDFHYGTYLASIKTSEIDGIVNGFFLFQSDTNEIDVEFLKLKSGILGGGKDDNRTVLFSVQGVGSKTVKLTFDPSQDFHTYGFVWKEDKVEFVVDGKIVTTISGKMPTRPGKIMLNNWTGNKEFGGGPPPAERTMRVDWVCYDPLGTNGRCASQVSGSKNQLATSTPPGGIVFEVTPTSPATTPATNTAESYALLVMDTSGSMSDPDMSGTTTKIQSARRAASDFVELVGTENTLGGNHQVGVVAFNTSAYVVQEFTIETANLLDNIDRLYEDGFTAMSQGIQLGLNQFNGVSSANKNVYLLSDGLPNVLLDGTGDAEISIAKEEVFRLVDAAKDEGVCIHTIGFGAADPVTGEVSFDPEFLREIAERSGCGNYYTADDLLGLSSVYIDLRHAAMGTVEFKQDGMIQPLETIQFPEIQIAANTSEILFTIKWEGSRIEPLLTSPSGEQIDLTDPGVSFTSTGTLATVIYPNPAPGKWQLGVFGSEIPNGGERFHAVASTRKGVILNPDGGGGFGFVLIGLAIAGGLVFALTRSSRKRMRGSTGTGQAFVRLPDGRAIPITDNTIIGRGSGASLRLGGAAVSRTHARLFLQTGTWYIQDLNSAGGTLVNGRRTTIAALHVNDVIRIGEHTLTFLG